MSSGWVASPGTSIRRILTILACTALILAPYAAVSPGAAHAASSEQEKIYDFLKPSDYSYDPRVVSVGGGKASLKALPLDTGWWKKTYSWGSDSGLATGVATDAQGSVFTSGYFSYNPNYGIWLRKVDARSGSTLWSKTYTKYSSCRSFDADTDPSGNLIVCGDAENFAFVARYSGDDGTLLWEKRFSYGSFFQTATGIACYPNGDVLVAGWYYDGGMRACMWVAKLLGSNGKRVWYTTEAAPGTDLMPGGAECDAEGNAYVSGSVWRPGSNNIIARKYSPACTPVWAREYDFGPQEQGYDISVDPQGNPCIAASIVIPSGSMTASLIKLLAPTGDVSWRTTFEPYTNSNTFGKGVSFDSRGEVFLTGCAFNTITLRDNAFLSKYDPRGNLLWSRMYTGEDRHWLGERVATDAFGNAALCGYTDLSNLRSGLLISSPPGRYTPYPQPVTPKACVDLKDRDALSFKAELFSSRTPPRFQLSPDNANWLYHGNEGWAPAATPENANTAEVVSKHIVEFNARAPDTLYVRALLSSNGILPCSIGRIEVGAAPSDIRSIWYLADGCTSSLFGFEEYVEIMNPNSCDVYIDIQCMEEDGDKGSLFSVANPDERKLYPGDRLLMDAYSRATVHVDHFRPESPGISLRLTATDSAVGGSPKSIVVERTMFHERESEERDSGSIAVGTPFAHPTWYFSEGCTGHGFETYLLLQNPFSNTAIATVTYMYDEDENKAPKKTTHTLSGRSRTTITASLDEEAGTSAGFAIEVDAKNTDGEECDIICERSMFGNGRACFDANLGTTETSDNWYFAEGCTGLTPNAGQYETWLLIQNPSDEDANVAIQYMTDSGAKDGPSNTMKPNTRWTVNVAEEEPGVPNNFNVASAVSSDVPIVCERAVYWGDRNGSHTTTGYTAPATFCHFAEGCTVTKEVRQGDKKVIDGFETYLCVQNPNDQPIKVEAVCLTPCLPAEAGNTSYKYRFSVGANSRKTLVMNGEERSEEIPYDPANPVGFEDKEISVRLKSASPFIAERSLYWHNKTGGSDSIGYPTDKQLGDMDKIK